MSLILNIDTSLETALVNIADNGNVIHEQLNPHQKDHSSFLEPAVKEILQKTGIQFSDLAAIAVVSGPGSYTGLRVGMASVKAMCYALKKPLILLNKLEVLSVESINQIVQPVENALFCAMIDARRLEVFTAVYNDRLEEMLAPQSMVLNEESFKETLETNQMFFFGNGAKKWFGLCQHKNARFIEIENEGRALAQLSSKMLNNQGFSDIAYSAPAYLKEVFI